MELIGFNQESKSGTIARAHHPHLQLELEVLLGSELVELDEECEGEDDVDDELRVEPAKAMIAIKRSIT